MLRFFRASKSRSETEEAPRRAAVAREVLHGALLLCAAVFLSLIARAAMGRGETAPAVVFSVGAFLALIWLALAPLARLAHELDLSRWSSPFSFGITPAGGFFILTVFLIALVAVNTSNNLLYLILALLLSITVVSGVFARLSLRSIFVSLQVPENVFERENVSIKISLNNQKRFFTSFSILAEDLALQRARRGGRFRKFLPRKAAPPAGITEGAPVLHHPAYFPAIPAGESRAELISQSFPRRGKYHLEGLRLSTRFPFGFFRRGERVAVSGEVLVYPSIREVSSDFHLLPFLPGKLEGKRVGHGESLYAIRQYREDENARLIHWKATAKTGKLMAREYAREEESEFCLILDTAIHHEWPENSRQFEKAVSMAAGLAAHFAREGAEFAYLTPHEYVPRGTGIEHLYRILRLMAVVQCEAARTGVGADISRDFSEGVEEDQLRRILSEKVFKILLTSRQRGILPAPVWRSSHVIYFDEL